MKPVWTVYLSGDVYYRLCDCRTIKSDLSALVNAMWSHYCAVGKDEQGFTREDALVAVLELLDCSSCSFDLSKDEYDALCR